MRWLRRSLQAGDEEEGLEWHVDASGNLLVPLSKPFHNTIKTVRGKKLVAGY